ncbi:unnamed protein product [Durusdinium trenchii]|uniref:Uncharacterized protein n=1 Tax=Durusdinium trenchii TaxID=1381693 RepID=A0ABP0LT99_9DINO
MVYVSGISLVFPSFIADEGEHEITIECGEELSCGSSRVRLVRDSCDSNISGSEWLALQTGVNKSIVNVLSDGMVAGAHYILCTELEPSADLANETPEVGDSGWTLYVSPLSAFQPEVLLASPQQVLRLNCSSTANCSTQTQGFLSFRCGSSGQLAPLPAADRTPPATLHEDPDASAEWRLSLDTSQLVPGQHYKLCLDIDGLGSPGQSSATSIFISPIEPGLQTVKTEEAQSIALHCVQHAACSTASEWYLTADSCGDPSPSPEAEASGHLEASQAGGWVAHLDGRQLRPGIHYHFCLDLDGAGSGRLWAGDTGFQVYASGIMSLAPAQVLISAVERLHFMCAAGGCPQDALFWLARPNCEDQTARVSVVNESTGMIAILDTTSVQAGQWLELCSDLDGEGPLRQGGTGLFVYISGIAAVADPWVQRWVGSLYLDCARSPCTAEAFLALECASHSGQALASAVAQLQDADQAQDPQDAAVQGDKSDGTERRQVVFDLQNIVSGIHYRLCTDFDGSGPMISFFSGFTVYVTSVRKATPDLVVKRQANQHLLLDCDPSGCPAAAEAFAADNCSIVPPVYQRLTEYGARRIATVDASAFTSRWYRLCMDEDGQASSALQAGPVGNVFVSPVSGISPDTLPAGGENALTLECETCSDQVRVFLASSCSQNASDSRALFNDGAAWTAVLDTFLEPGYFYQLCVIVENVTGPSGEAVFLLPNVTVQEEAISGTAQLSFDCESGCGALSQVRLATDCSHWETMLQVPVFNASYSSPLSTARRIGGLFLADLDASAMPAGQSVHVCIGAEDMPVGKSGLSVFISPVSAVSTPIVFNAAAESLELNCSACSTTSEVFLAKNCHANASSPRTPAAQLTPFAGGYQWAAQLDTTSLEPGQSYHLCVDVDGPMMDFPSGRSLWEIYASAFSLPGHFSVALSPNSQLKVPCIGCSSGQAFLADACPLRNLLLEDANHSNMSRLTDTCGGLEVSTAATTFKESAEEFVLELDTCSLTPGVHFSLCTDLDGFASRLEIGNSGIEIYVSPLKSIVGSERLVKGKHSLLTMACSGCMNGVTTAQLAMKCDESPNAVPVAVSPNSTGAVLLQEGSQGFQAHFDTRGLGSGRRYRVCLDLDGPSPTYRAGDTGLSIYLTAITSISFGEAGSEVREESGQESISAGRDLQLVLLCLPGSGGCGVETEAFLSLVGDCTPVSPPQQLQRLPSFNGLALDRFGLTLSTALLPSGYTYQICVDADGAGNLFPAGETGFSIYISPVRVAVFWGEVLRIVCHPGGCSSSALGFISSDCAIGSTSAYLSAVTKVANPWPKILYLANDSTPAELWEIAVPAPAGLELRLCLDVDGSGPMPVGDAQGVFTSGIQELLTQGVPQGVDEVITFACSLGGGCSERSQAYLAKTCDINDPDASTIEVLGEMTSSSLLIPDSSSEAGNGTEVFSVHLRTDGLPAGRHYSFCIDLDGVDWALKTGDSLHQVYLSPVKEVEFQKSAAYTVLRFNCSDCSDMSEGFLALDCYAAALALKQFAGNESEVSDTSDALADAIQMQDANFSSFTRSTRFSFDGNWTLGVSTETLQGGLRYRLCMDLDGGEKQDYLLGDTGVRVFISPVTAVTPTVVFAGNSSVTILCQRGGCDFLGHSYLAPDCHVPPAPTQCSFMEDVNDTNGTNDSNDSNLTALVDPESPPIMVDSTPLSRIGDCADACSANFNLACTKSGRYRLCIVGQEETTFGAVATYIEDSGFAIDVL